MRVLLMRHGLAVSELANPERPLSGQGRLEVDRMARALARLGLGVTSIRHSTKLRARETAEALARALTPEAELTEATGLLPEDDPRVIAGELPALKAPVALVGHLPHLARLASLLVLGDEGRELVVLPPGGVAALDRDGGAWHLGWVLTPDIVAAVDVSEM